MITLITVALLVAAAPGAGTIAVHVEHLEGLPDAQADALAQAIAQVAEVASGRSAKLDPARGACKDKAACVEEIRARSGADAVLLASAYGAVSKIALFLELYERGRGMEEMRVDLELAEKSWRPALVRALSALIPRAQKEQVAIAPREEPRREPAETKREPAETKRELPAAKRAPAETKRAPAEATATAPAPGRSKIDSGAVLRWTVIGAGGALAITGAALVISSYASQSSLDDALSVRDRDGLITGIDVHDAQSEADSIGTRRTIGLVLGLAGAAVVTGGILWLTGSDRSPPAVSAAIAPGDHGGASFALQGSF